jgi:hypothetical protein
MSRQRPITIWSLLALAVMIVGMGVTLGLHLFWLRAWAETGVKFSVSHRRAPVDLPAGSNLVWYESRQSVPTGDVVLNLYNSAGDRVPVGHPSGDVSYLLSFSDLSGRALWELHLAKAGRYEFEASNNTVTSDDQIPADDRIVFLKSPDSLEQANTVRKVLVVTSATITITLVIVLYIVHGVTLAKRRAAVT